MYIKSNNTSHIFEILSNCFGLLFTGGSFALVIFLLEKDFEDPVVVAFLTLIVGLIFDRINNTISTRKANELSDDKYHKILNIISQSANLEVITDEKLMYTELKNKMTDAVYVRNTFLGIKSDRKSSVVSDDAVINIYDSFFNGTGSKWSDIVGVPELYSDRYKLIKKPKRNDVEHYVFVAKNSGPIINFVIIDYNYEGQVYSEVFFGWQHSYSASSYTYFRSSDEQLVGLFSSYFESLKDRKLDKFKIDYSANSKVDRIKNSSSILDKQGCWVTIGYAGREIRSIACFDIKFEDYEVSIVGRAIWKNRFIGENPSFGLEDFNHSNGSVSYTDKKIFLEYNNNSTLRRGICVYKFKKVNKTEKLSGYLQSDGYKDRVQIIGFKLGALAFSNYDQYSLKIKSNHNALQSLAGTHGLEISWKDFGIDIEELVD